MEKSFFQGDIWMSFQKAAGRPVCNLGGAKAVIMSLWGNLKYLYFPRLSSQDIASNFYQNLRELLIKQFLFARFDPEDPELLAEIKRQCSKPKFDLRVYPAKSIQPKQTLLLDLNQDEQTILAKLKPKTRYNIKVSQKHEIKVSSFSTASEFDNFWQLMEATASRDQIKLHSKYYYQKMLATLGKSGHCRLYLAFWQSQVLAGALIGYFGDRAYYFHGASSNSERQRMAPYLMHWKIICDAKKAGKKWYDWWGIAPAQIIDGKIVIDENHPWQGISRFKLGFAPTGKYIEYPPSFDLTARPLLYQLYRFLKKIKV